MDAFDSRIFQAYSRPLFQFRYLSALYFDDNPYFKGLESENRRESRGFHRAKAPREKKKAKATAEAQVLEENLFGVLILYPKTMEWVTVLMLIYVDLSDVICCFFSNFEEFVDF